MAGKKIDELADQVEKEIISPEQMDLFQKRGYIGRKAYEDTLAVLEKMNQSSRVKGEELLDLITDH